MKKLFALLIVGCMTIGLLTGCSSGEEPASDVPLSGEIEIIEDDADAVPEGMARSYLTGEWIDEELATQRPIAVMMGNTTAALPQYGVGSAEVIYESPVEGGITRLMAIIHDYESVEKIMSVRSCRYYYVPWMLEYDAIYVHYGQSDFANGILAEDYVNNLSGLDGTIESVVFARDNSRSAPHNAYATGEKIVAGIEKKGYEKSYAEDYNGSFTFNEDDENEINLDSGTDAIVVNLGYSINKPHFDYDEEEGVYYRYQYGDKHIDGADNSQLTCENIILQVCDWSYYEGSESLNIKQISSGNGYFVTNGKMVPITWEKDSTSAPTKYYYEDGSEIVLNQGKTWVCIILDSDEGNVSFTAE